MKKLVSVLILVMLLMLLPGTAAAADTLVLRYDDHVAFTGKTVEIVDAGKPASYQVGYGVAENTVRDTAVVALDGDTLIAVGIGTAKVRVDGQVREVTVEAAPISLLLLVGQSNMRGSEGNAKQSIVCPDGMVYATYGDDRGADNTAMTVSNATHFAPSALTGTYSSVNAAGTTDCLSGYPVYSLLEAGAGKIGPDSGFAYEWVKQTGEKVWIVNAAHGGTSITTWQDGGENYEEAVLLFSACQETLRKEIAAGHYTLSHMGYFWCQGCSDRTQSAEWYVKKYIAMHENFKRELAFDHDSTPATADKTFEFGGIIPVRVGSTVACYRDGTHSDSNPYAYHESFVDLRFSGPRVAQYWMINNPDLTDIWGVCDIGEDWVWMPDGTNGVTEYFQSHYPNGTVDYTTQVAQKASWYTPTTPAAVHDSVHYNQIGYNEIGRESVRNALIMLGESKAPQVETSVEFLTWDGYTPAKKVTAATAGTSGTLVVPKVSPVWKSKTVTYALSDGLSYNYYDLLAADAQTTGILRAVGMDAAVSVVRPEPGYLYAEHLSELPEEVCGGINLWAVLEHDKYYFASGKNWAVYSSGNVPSVTIPVEPGDQVFATSFGAAKENGHATSNGIRVTFFGAYGVVKTMEPAATYKEFSTNGYLTAPEGATAINVPMWSDSNENELYILSAEHKYNTSSVCTVCRHTQGNSVPNKSELSDYKGKVISILSASTSTFAGYIPEADGFNLAHRARYPQSDLLTDVNETWWMQVINELDAKLGINESWAGSQVLNTQDTNSGDLGPDAAMASLTRIQNLGANGTPDVIFFFGAGNDIGRGVTLGSFDAKNAPTQVDLTTTKWSNLADAYVAAIMRLKHFYPDSQIVAMTTYAMPSYATAAKLDKYGPVLRSICEHYGVEYLNLRDCGVTSAMLPDKIHPNAEGMDKITEAVLNKLIQDIPMDAGENTVYSVTHKLNAAQASKHYYKGVSAGAAFTETVSGKGVSVSVTMGGKDITASAYKNGSISIPKVTGDLVITARGAFTADGHLQKLPDKMCAGTNLWTTLKPENIYYTASGWGNTSAGTSWSITFPVKSGDRIWATSLGPVATNGSTANGVRVTWFSEDGTVNSISREVVYAEFAKNGYITAPAGAVALNLPMTNNQAHYAVYVLSASHSYKSTVTAPTCTKEGYTIHTCTLCGDSYVDSKVAAKGHTNVTVPGKAATCTATGLTDGAKCSVCGVVTKAQQTIAAKGHTNVTVPGKAATCTAPGLTDGAKCSVCGTVTKKQETIAAKGHTNVTIPGKAATCTAPGLTDGAKCSVCGVVTKTQQTIPAKGHTNVTIPGKAATCTATGLTDGAKCSVCGVVTKTQQTIAAKGHTNLTVPGKAATCTATGLTDGAKCSVCGVITKTQQTIAAKGHTNVTVPGKAATCTATGLTDGAKCSVCGVVTKTQQTIAAKGHTAVTVPGKAATCIATGLTDGAKCSVCGIVTKTQQTIAAKGHTNVTVPGKAATCTATGLTDGAKCSVCGVVTKPQQTIAAKGHTAVTVPGKAATCTATGLTDGAKCSVCGVVTKTQQTIAAKGHTEVTVPGKAATCTATGLTDGAKCSVCGTVTKKQETIAAKGHTNVTVPGKAATCTASGLTDGAKCSVCGIVTKTQQTIAAKGHTNVTVPGKAATCTAAGLTDGAKCSVCGTVTKKQETIAAKGHTNVTVPGKAATCTATGLTDGAKCSVCGVETKKQETIAALGHSWSEWKQTKAPTEETEGEKTRTCSRCKTTETESIPKLSHTHSYVDEVTAPTCTEKGYTTHTCKCGHSYVDTYVNAKGHVEVTIPGKEATEETTGLTEGKKCGLCGTIIVPQQTIPMKDHVHQYNFAVIDGLLYESCSCGEKTLAVRVAQSGKTITVTLLKELFPTTIYAARYDTDGRLLGMRFAQMDGTEISFAFASDAGDFRVFFLTTDFVPWLNAVSPTKK